MDKITLESYAKINLSLDVHFKRDDNYHEITTIMQQIGLKDILTLEDRKEGITIECNNPLVPLNSSNLVHKAWDIMKKTFNIDRGVYIKIDKNIPVAAGLAGGSTNAAAVLKGLNEMWGLNLSSSELMNIGVEIGADVPFCIMGGTAIGRGIGEKLTRIKSFSNKMVLLASPAIQVSTAHVYNSLKLDEIENRPDIEQLIKSIEKDDIYYLSKNMVNIMEEATIREFPIIQELKEDMIRYGALGSLMSGSGPTVFGIFDDEDKLLKCKSYLEGKVNKVIISKTI